MGCLSKGVTKRFLVLLAVSAVKDAAVWMVAEISLSLSHDSATKGQKPIPTATATPRDFCALQARRMRVRGQHGATWTGEGV